MSLHYTLLVKAAEKPVTNKKVTKKKVTKKKVAKRTSKKG